MPNMYKSYSLVGGQPVKIDPVEITEPGTTFAEEGHAFNPVVCSVSSYLVPLEEPYGAEDGVYICTATGSDESTVCGVCVVSGGTVEASYGDGTFAIDTSGNAPTLAWTPSITAETVVVWYAAGLAV